MSDRESLLSMGFSEAKVAKALKVTKNAGLQPALDWLIAHADEPDPSPEEASSSKDADGDEDMDESKIPDVGEAKSLKCLQCGKIFKNTALASYHGDKSGHDQFEESTEEVKPLTEEEKKQKLAELRERMAAKKAAASEQDKQDALLKEKLRRKEGQTRGDIVKEMQEREMKNQAAEAKRDKAREQDALKAVRAKIAADKAKRLEQAAKEKAVRLGQPDPSVQPSASSSAAAAAPPPPAAARPASTEARLAIRLPSAQTITTTLPATSTLRQVAEWVVGQPAASASTTGGVSSLKFVQTFPRKTFTSSQFDSTLTELGLTPSAALLLQS